MPHAASLIGRAAEAERLEDALASVADGTAQLIVIEGEPGIGKTSLADAARAGSVGSRFRWFTARANELAQARPFRVIADAFACDRDAGDERRRAIAALLRTRQEGSRDLLLDAFEDLAEAEGLVGPIALAIDDLQWADGPTVTALGAILARYSTLPIAVVATLRSATAGEQVSAFLRAARRVTTQIEVPPLDEPAIGALAAERLQRAPGPGLRSLLSSAGGNPFYVIELLDALTASGGITVSDGIADTMADAVPPSLIPTIMATLAPLPDDALEVLRFAAVMGVDVALDSLGIVMERSAADLHAPIRASMERKILEDADDHLRFRHDLIRESIYADLGAPLRASMHGQIGWALARSGAPALQVAAHLARGTDHGADAAGWIIDAAKDHALDVPTQAGLLRRALEIHPEHPDRGPIVRRLAKLDGWMGRPGDTVDDLTRLLADATDTAERLATIGQLVAARGVTGQSDLINQGVAIARELPADAPPGIALLRAQFTFYAGHYEAALSETEEVYAKVRTDPDATDRRGDLDELLAETANQSGWLAVLLGRASLAVERTAECLSYASGAPGRAVYWRHHVWALADGDRADEFETALAAANAAADGAGNLMAAGEVRKEAAHWFHSIGRWDDALLECDVFGSLMGASDESPSPYSTRQWIAFRKDGLDASAPPEVEEGDQWLATVSALAALDRGDREAAGRVAGRLIERLTGSAPEHWPIRRHFDLLPALARIAVEVGDRASARQALEHLAASAEGADAPGVHLAAARVGAIVDGDVDAARWAVGLASASPRLIFRADAYVEAAAVLPTDEARPLLAEALAIYGDVGAVGDIRRAAASLKHLGADRKRTTPPKQRPTSGWGSLTTAERDVVRLAVEGLTNREIGARLFVSHRTVATHLSHVFDKLGIRSRVELARQAIDHFRSTS